MFTTRSNLAYQNLIFACESGADLALCDLRAAGLFGGADPSAARTALLGKGWTETNSDFISTTDSDKEPSLLIAGYKTTRTMVIKGLKTENPMLVVKTAFTNGPSNGVFRLFAVHFSNPSASNPGLGFIGIKSFNGGNLNADSYNSAKGAYDPATNHGDGVTVGTSSTDPTKLKLGPTGSVFGKIGFGGTKDKIVVSNNTGIRSQSHVWNTASATQYTDPKKGGVDPAALVGNMPTVSQTVNEPAAANAPILTVGSGNKLLVDGKSVANNTLTAGTYRINADFNIAGNTGVKITGPVNLVADKSVYGPSFAPRIQISGTGVFEISSTVPNSKLSIYTSGSLNWSGNVVTNSTSPSALQIISTASEKDLSIQQLNFSGNVDLYGVVYAPCSQVNLSGNVNFYGSVVGGDIINSGNVSVHFDEALSGAGSTTKLSFALLHEPTGENRKNIAATLPK